jgi:hypothetical protein
MRTLPRFLYKAPATRRDFDDGLPARAGGIRIATKPNFSG